MHIDRKQVYRFRNHIVHIIEELEKIQTLCEEIYLSPLDEEENKMKKETKLDPRIDHDSIEKFRCT